VGNPGLTESSLTKTICILSPFIYLNQNIKKNKQLIWVLNAKPFPLMRFIKLIFTNMLWIQILNKDFDAVITA